MSLTPSGQEIEWVYSTDPETHIRPISNRTIVWLPHFFLTFWHNFLTYNQRVIISYTRCITHNTAIDRYHNENKKLPSCIITEKKIWKIKKWKISGFKIISKIQRKLCSRLYSIKLEFYSKNDKFVFKPPFGGVMGYVRTSFIARWTACGRLPIHYNWTFVASSYSWDIISRYWSKSAFFKRGRITLSANFRWKGKWPTNVFWYHKTRLITLSCGVKTSAVCFFISLQSTRVIDRQTELRSPRPR